MKKLIPIGAFLLLLSSCNSTKTTTTINENTTAQISEQEKSNTVSLGTDEEWTEAEIAKKEAKPLKTMLVGPEDRQALAMEPFGKWYIANYENYNVKSEIIPELKKALEGVQITTFMGTWCGDSKRETPRFFKILDTAQFEEGRSGLITVDRTKKNPIEFTEGNNIIRVPTFIFKKNGKEIGRIVERPVESLEEDMLKILTGEPYKHSYEN